MLFSLVQLIAKPVFRVLFSVEHYGLENIPKDGPVIVAGNHPSYLDPVLVGLPIARPIRFMAWDALFKIPIFGQIIKAVGAFPVDIRKGKGESAFREAVKVLNEGNALVIFPEGQRSEQAAMGELRTGVARLAIETGATIVPTTIGGASRAWPKGKLLPRSAKIMVRYHPPIILPEEERSGRRDDREYHYQIMERVATSINRSLTPSIRGADTIEQWYRQPPPHIRSFEWAPLIAVLIALLVARTRGTLALYAPTVLYIGAAYYLYLAADLTVIKPARLAKWIRNSAPIWLILLWHIPLTKLIAVPVGDQNLILATAGLAAFFPFFYEDYYSLQKFVRGVVASYYYSLALQLALPHGLGVMTATLGMIAIFVFWYRVIYRWWIAGAMIAAMLVSLWLSPGLNASLLAYAGLAFVVILYLQTLISIAYDIRRAGNVSLQKT